MFHVIYTLNRLHAIKSESTQYVKTPLAGLFVDLDFMNQEKAKCSKQHMQENAKRQEWQSNEGLKVRKTKLPQSSAQ